MAKEAPVAPQSAISTQQPAISDAYRRRVIVERIEPEIDGGRFPIKRTVGETVDVTATIFADGHDVVGAVLRDRRRAGGLGAGGWGKQGAAETVSPEPRAPSPSQAQPEWRETPMTSVAPGTDRWTATFDV